MIFFIITIILTYIFLIYKYNLLGKDSIPHHISYFPFFGSITDMFRGSKFYYELEEKYGKISSFSLFGRRVEIYKN
jgi:hypothetical protein